MSVGALATTVFVFQTQAFPLDDKFSSTNETGAFKYSL